MAPKSTIGLRAREWWDSRDQHGSTPHGKACVFSLGACIPYQQECSFETNGHFLLSKMTNLASNIFNLAQPLLNLPEKLHVGKMRIYSKPRVTAETNCFR